MGHGPGGPAEDSEVQVLTNPIQCGPADSEFASRSQTSIVLQLVHWHGMSKMQPERSSASRLLQSESLLRTVAKECAVRSCPCRLEQCGARVLSKSLTRAAESRP
jgi:hypothetical protein